MVLEKVVKIIKEELDLDQDITLDTNLRNDLGADSMDAVQIVMAFEEEFEISIPDEELVKFVTVKDIVDYINSHKN